MFGGSKLVGPKYRQVRRQNLIGSKLTGRTNYQAKRMINSEVNGQNQDIFLVL